jgi:DNA-binding LytR/AlgR family response regulator
MIRTLIIEDEESAAIRIEKLLRKADEEITILARLDSVESSVKWLKANSPPDLIMLDIQLADGLSFEIFRQVKIGSFVIFTTAFDEYAIKAFEVNSIDYLLKPVDEEKLVRSINKFKNLRSSFQPVNLKDFIDILESRRSGFKKRFAVTVGSKIRSVETQNIAYFYSIEKSTFLCTSDNHHYAIEFSLDKVELMLDPERFFRINRQYIVSFTNIGRISVLSKSRITIETIPPAREELPVSPARAHEFRLWLDK